MTRTRGFTLIEMLVSIVLLGIVMTGALRLFRGINTAVNGAVDRMDAMQNLRFGITSLDREVRAAGAGTTETQPTLIYIDAHIIAFNGDLVSTIANSPTAVYYNPDIDPNASNALPLSGRFTIPTTSVQYPDSTYRTAGALSPAEAVIFWFVLDTATSRTDDYALMRQVNNSTPELIARNLLPYPSRPFFEWMRVDTAGNLLTVTSGLPWRHSNPIHGSTTDTGAVSRIDSIRAVRVNLYATNGRTGTAEVRRSLVTTIRIPNAGLTKQRSCGDAPIFGRTVTAVFQVGTENAPVVRVSWTPAIDESGGERDVERYLVYRRTLAGAFDDALQSSPGGQGSYTFDDASVRNDSTYVYGVTALDCTPLESSLSTASSVLIPPHP